jgi:hypothetical protein
VSDSIRELWRPGCGRCSARRFLWTTGARSDETETMIGSTGRPGIVSEQLVTQEQSGKHVPQVGPSSLIPRSIRRSISGSTTSRESGDRTVNGFSDYYAGEALAWTGGRKSE